MPLPTTKAELLHHLRHAYEALDAEFETVDPSHEREEGLEGGISCCDLIAYQIGWGTLLMGWETEEAEGRMPVMPSPKFKWNQLGPLARSFYHQQSGKSLDQLRHDFADLVQALGCWIDSLSEQELFVPHQRQWTGEKWAMVKWIQVNTIAPYRSARANIRRWKRNRTG